MLIVSILLGLLLIVALAWGWQQRRELVDERAYWQRRQTERTPDELPPLFLATAAALESGLLLLDANYRLQFANAVLPQMLGLETEAIQGQSVISVLRDYQADALIKTAINSGDVQSTTLHPVLSPRTLHITCYPLHNISPYSAIVLLRDVTQLAQLERARREMVANVSHELRSPLATIKLLVETLQSPAPRTPPPDKAREMLGQIDDELDSMTHLVEELRELSQIESGRMAMTLRASDLAAIVERTASRVRPQAERRHLHLLTEIAPDLPCALIDGERIGQVLLNLLNNALKFTPEGGTITITAQQITSSIANDRAAHELAQTGLDHALLVAVADTGIGIPAPEVDRVFERFYKVDRARTRNSGGTGLGLAIAKHIVERHGGRVWVTSEEGVGSTFAMLLPTA